MRKVKICIELDDDKYRAYQEAARQRGESVEALVNQTVNLLFRELEQKQKEEEDDHPIFFP